MKVPREEVERFIAEHGGVVIHGETPEGPVLTMDDGWALFLPVEGEPEATAPDD
jgi:hypothetical protein